MADGNAPRVLPDLSARMAQMEDMLARLEAENVKLRNAAALAGIRSSVILKVNDGEGQAGGISCFVNSRFPMTAYASQWLLLADYLKCPPDSPIRTFIDQHKTRLAWKPTKG